MNAINNTLKKHARRLATGLAAIAAVAVIIGAVMGFMALTYCVVDSTCPVPMWGKAIGSSLLVAGAAYFAGWMLVADNG